MKPTTKQRTRAPMKRGRSAGKTTERVDVPHQLETIEGAAKPGEPLIKTGTGPAAPPPTNTDGVSDAARFEDCFGAPEELVPALEEKFGGATVGVADALEATRRRPGSRAEERRIGALKKEEK